jgi:hypothetical protein
LQANIDIALRHPDYSEKILAHLAQIDKDFVVMQGLADQIHKTKVGGATILNV